jgi:internalin A
VKADPAEKRVIISVRGPTREGRRRLLAVIRSDFDHIHRDLKRKPLEMVPMPGHPDLILPYEKLRVLEDNGIARLTEVIGNRVVELDVRDLLNGVDLPAVGNRISVRKGAGLKADLMGPLSLFYSYSHKDEELRNQLETHLKLLQRQQVIAPWHDRMIDAGEEWRGQISDKLERADLILLLISPDFIASDYCYDKEMTVALQRQDANEARVIPVIVRDVSWSKAQFARLQAMPRDGKAVTLWSDRDTAWRNVAEGIERVAEELRKMRR